MVLSLPARCSREGASGHGDTVTRGDAHYVVTRSRPYRAKAGGCDVIASLPGLRLREVVHAALEKGLVLVAGDVLGDVGAGTFGVAHLAEDTSARAGDAFDGFE